MMRIAIEVVLIGAMLLVAPFLPAQPPGPPPGGPGQSAEMESLLKSFHLTPEQQAKYDAARAETSRRMRVIHQGKVDGSLTQEQVLKQALQSHKQFNAWVKEILSPKQYAQWEPLREADHREIARAHKQRDEKPAKPATPIGKAAVPPAKSTSEWPRFRGPNDGVCDGTLPDRWDRNENVRWVVPVPGYGWSSPVVWGDKLFLTTASADGQSPPQAKGPGGGDPTPTDKVFRWEVHCLDRSTGKTLWKQTAAERKPTTGNHISNTYASETPVTDGKRVYAYFGMAGLLACYDVSGKPLWTRKLGPYRVFANWGTSSSPVQDGDRIFVQCDNNEQSFVAAFDAVTGEELWRANRSEPSTWGSPVIWRNTHRTELVLMGTRRICSYDPATGLVFWELTTLEGATRDQTRTRPGNPRPAGPGPGRQRLASGGCKSTPIATADMIYVGMASKIGGQELGPMWAVKAGAVGDISLKESETSNVHIAWFRPDAGPHFSSALVYGGLLYVFPAHGGVLHCFNADTGREVYQERLAGAGDFMASPWAHDGKIFNVDGHGVTFVVKAGPKFQLLGTNDINEMSWASPAAVHGAVFLRTVEHLYCIGPHGTANP